MYLEQRHRQWLQEHPVSVNLLSAFICFNIAIVFLARILRWFAESERIQMVRGEHFGEWNLKLAELQRVVQGVWPPEVLRDVSDPRRWPRTLSILIQQRDTSDDSFPDVARFGQRYGLIALRAPLLEHVVDRERWQKIVGTFCAAGASLVDEARAFANRENVMTPYIAQLLEETKRSLTTLRDALWTEKRQDQEVCVHLLVSSLACLQNIQEEVPKSVMNAIKAQVRFERRVKVYGA
jgi:hypothetical protein